MVAYDYPILGVFWTFLIFFVFVMWFFILFRVIVDIFRSHDMGGWHKALWILFIVVLPYLGIFVYLIARGGKMQAHAIESYKQHDAATQAYIRQAAGTTSSPADEIHRLADLKERGVIDDADFERLKAKAINA
jgi:hypothetical protein